MKFSRWHCLEVAVALICLGWTQSHYSLFISGSKKDLQPSTFPGFILEGGGEDSDEAVGWLVHRAHGGDFLTLRASGGDDMNNYARSLGALNSGQTILFHDRQASFDEEVISKINHAEAIFLAGGDQSQYQLLWKNSPVADEINQKVAAGTPIGGISAGLAVMGQYYFSAERDTLDSATALSNPFDSHVTIRRGLFHLPLLEHTITDTHFATRDRMGRLLVFLARIVGCGWEKSARGIAVDEGAALIVEPTGRSYATGEGNVYFILLQTNSREGRPGKALSAGPYLVAKIRGGGSFDLKRWSGLGPNYQLVVRNGQIFSTQVGGKIY